MRHGTARHGNGKARHGTDVCGTERMDVGGHGTAWIEVDVTVFQLVSLCVVTLFFIRFHLVSLGSTWLLGLFLITRCAK